MRVFIQSGHLSADNGAIFPLSLYFALAKAIGTDPLSGESYSDDKLDVPDADWPTVEQLLIETNLLYRVQGIHDAWQNVKTNLVRERLNGRSVN